MSSPGGETYRLEAFADAVFAIAITLLIIEIRLPRHDEVVQHGGLVSALLQLWPLLEVNARNVRPNRSNRSHKGTPPATVAEPASALMTQLEG